MFFHSLTLTPFSALPQISTFFINSFAHIKHNNMYIYLFHFFVVDSKIIFKKTKFILNNGKLKYFTFVWLHTFAIAGLTKRDVLFFSLVSLPFTRLYVHLIILGYCASVASSSFFFHSSLVHPRSFTCIYFFLLCSFTFFFILLEVLILLFLPPKKKRMKKQTVRRTTTKITKIINGKRT